MTYPLHLHVQANQVPTWTEEHVLDDLERLGFVLELEARENHKRARYYDVTPSRLTIGYITTIDKLIDWVNVLTPNYRITYDITKEVGIVLTLHPYED